MTKKNYTKARIADSLTLIFVIAISIICVTLVTAIPSGPTVSYVSNSTSATAGIGTLRGLDDGGHITTVTLDVMQQNFGWKAYVGNVTGKLTLDDANNNTIYDWTLSTIKAEVYISKNQSVGWSNIGCAARSVLEAEDIAFGKAASDDNINNTFNETTHKSFIVAGTNITASSCPSIATYVNDTAQTVSVNAKFQEVLLNDSAGNLVYATIAETGGSLGYDNQTYDFQAIIPDNESAAVITPYYFYVELG